MRGRLVVVALVAGAWLAVAGTAWGDSVTPRCTTDQGGSHPCQAGWYTSPVLLSWTWSPVTGSGSCATQSFTEDAIQTLSCEVTWPDGTTVIQRYTIHVELSSPSASGTPNRPPDSAGWYNHPVAVDFHGSAFSGIAFCSSATYAGPASLSATVTGSCTDNAGKTAGAAVAFRYDASPPALRIATNPADRTVKLNWGGTTDMAPVTSVTVTRKPGLRGHKSSLVYRGGGAGFRDFRVQDGVRYRYTISARDQAGNTSARTVAVTPGPRLLQPTNGAIMTLPPLLSWTPVRGATYYNVQLYRAGKVLSAWPAHARFQLRGSWRFGRHRYHLRPGRYRWYVWPGFGPRAAARYGPAIGSGTFTVSR